ncbi:MAG: hypothetical protein KDA16_07815 [Phycisphaerales bacterium]|nr:hypothetical protein [Phycisphaerales bacterium]
MNTTKPIHQVRLGTVKAAVWANPTDDDRTRYSVTVQRIYRDNGEWKRTTSFRRNDVLVLAKVLDLAHSWICQQPNERAGAA